MTTHVRFYYLVEMWKQIQRGYFSKVLDMQNIYFNSLKIKSTLESNESLGLSGQMEQQKWTTSK